LPSVVNLQVRGPLRLLYDPPFPQLSCGRCQKSVPCHPHPFLVGCSLPSLFPSPLLAFYASTQIGRNRVSPLFFFSFLSSFVFTPFLFYDRSRRAPPFLISGVRPVSRSWGFIAVPDFFPPAHVCPPSLANQSNALPNWTFPARPPPSLSVAARPVSFSPQIFFVLSNLQFRHDISSATCWPLKSPSLSVFLFRCFKISFFSLLVFFF